MNILLLNLLRKAGITCYPLLVSTRENGKPEMSFPSLGQFDGVDILTFDEKNNMYLLDCTQSKLSYKTAPFNILNRMAFLVDLVEGKWIDVSIDKPLFTTSVNVNALIDSTGNVNGNAYMELTNIAKVQELETDTKNKVSLLASSGDNDIKVDSTVKLHDKDDNDTLIKKVQFHYALSNAGNLYFINPFLFTMFTKNPFKDTARFYDIDFGCGQVYTTSVHVLVPPGFTIDEVPKPGLIRMPDSSIMFKKEYFYNQNSILVRTSFTISRPEFEKEEYTAVHNFFDKVYSLINEQIILKKNDE